MESEALHRIIRNLTEMQSDYADLITHALQYYRPNDPFMLKMYDVQDRLHCQLRRMLQELPGVDPELLDRFDSLLVEHRLNLLLAMANIDPAVS